MVDAWNMASQSIKGADKITIETIKSKYVNYLVPSKVEIITHMFNINGVVISIYKTGTILVQGDFDKLDSYLRDLLTIQSPLDLDQLVCGSDEVGTGEIVGPCVFASFTMTSDVFSKLGNLKNQIKDSKTLSDDQINLLAPKLMAFNTHKTFTEEPPRINKYMKAGVNLNVIKTIGHMLVHNHKLDRKCVVDGFASLKNIMEYQKDLLKASIIDKVKNDWVIIEKAEAKFLAVACASIIARFVYLGWLKEKSRMYGFDLMPKSYANQVKIAKDLLLAHGMEVYSTIYKTEFKT